MPLTPALSPSLPSSGPLSPRVFQVGDRVFWLHGRTQVYTEGVVAAFVPPGRHPFDMDHKKFVNLHVKTLHTYTEDSYLVTVTLINKRTGKPRVPNTYWVPHWLLGPATGSLLPSTGNA